MSVYWEHTTVNNTVLTPLGASGVNVIRAICLQIALIESAALVRLYLQCCVHIIVI